MNLLSLQLILKFFYDICQQKYVFTFKLAIMQDLKQERKLLLAEGISVH